MILGDIFDIESNLFGNFVNNVKIIFIDAFVVQFKFLMEYTCYIKKYVSKKQSMLINLNFYIV